MEFKLETNERFLINRQDASIDLMNDIALKSAVYTKAEADVLLEKKADASVVYTKTVINEMLSAKADSSSVYDKNVIDSKLSEKSDKADTYTKAETQELIDDSISGITGIEYEVVQTLPVKGEKGVIYLIPTGDQDNIYNEYIWIDSHPDGHYDIIGTTEVDLSNYYTKNEADILLDKKADSSTVYTKTEVDELIPDVSHYATKTELSDGLSTKADSSVTYTKAEVDDLIPDVSHYATKTELSEGLSTKADSSVTYTKAEVDTLLDNKQDDISAGYGISMSANNVISVNDIVAIKSEVSSALELKADASSVYTKNETNTLLNAKADKDTTYTKSEVDGKLSGIYHYKGTVANSGALPADASNGDVYNTEDTGMNYAWNGTVWDALGSLADLSDYYTKVETNGLLSNKQEQLVSGSNIKTVNGVSLLANGNIDVSTARVTYDSSDNVIKIDDDKNKANLTVKNTEDNAFIVEGNYNSGTMFSETVLTLTYLENNDMYLVRNWSASGLNITVPSVMTDLENTQLPKLVYKSPPQDASNYQIVGMVAYEVFGPGGRINYIPVCQFTGQNQTELSVRGCVMGPNSKTAVSINAWVLLKRRK